MFVLRWPSLSLSAQPPIVTSCQRKNRRRLLLPIFAGERIDDACSCPSLALRGDKHSWRVSGRGSNARMRQELPLSVNHRDPRRAAKNCHRQKLSSSSIPRLMVEGPVLGTQERPGNRVGHIHARLFLPGTASGLGRPDETSFVAAGLMTDWPQNSPMARPPAAPAGRFLRETGAAAVKDGGFRPRCGYCCSVP
jgi:hypothetical protein